MKNPVILVHGFGDSASKMRHIEKSLKCSDWNVYAVSLKPSNGHVGIDELAQQLHDFITNNIQSDQTIDLIGFSMGGLICRYYIQNLNGLSKVEHFITISTPHNGTLTAFLLGNKGAKQMRYNSNFILELNNEVSKLESLKFTSIWTPFDLMIIPASSSHLTLGNEIKIRCVLHPLMVSNKQCINSIKRELLG